MQKEIPISEAVRYNTSLYQTPYNWSSKYAGLLIDNGLPKIIKNQFLNMLSVFSRTDIKSIDDIKRTQILRLDSDQINNNAEKAVKSLIRASAFLQFRCGVFDIKELPYELMMLPIAFCLVEDKVWNDIKAINKIEYWYWSCLMGGAYRERQNEQCIKDVRALYKWVKNETENPFENFAQKVLKEPGYSDKSLLLMKDDTHEVQTAIRKALLEYILSQEPKDFIYENIRLSAWSVGSEKTFDFEDKTQILKLNDHHIFPLKNATKIGQSSKEIRGDKKHILNSPLNRTFISEASNSKISSLDPANYFNYVSKVAQFGHCVPKDIKGIYQQNEVDFNKIYENFLELRFNELEKTLVLELDKLKS